MSIDFENIKKQINEGVCIVDKNQLLKWLQQIENIEQFKAQSAGLQKANEKLKRENEKLQKKCEETERKMRCVQAEIAAVKNIASREFSNNAKIRRKLRKMK